MTAGSMSPTQSLNQVWVFTLCGAVPTLGTCVSSLVLGSCILTVGFLIRRLYLSIPGCDEISTLSKLSTGNSGRALPH